MYSDIIAVTNRHLSIRPFMEQIERVCQLHPKALILREKDLSEEEYLLLARKVHTICKQYNIPFIPHFYPSVAQILGCDYLHLPLPVLRKQSEVIHQFSVVGTSVHSAAEAIESEKLGVSYLTAGHIYATDCKKGLPPRGLNFLHEVCNSVRIPVFGIGGITLDKTQLQELKNVGAAGGCIMSGMMKI